MATLILGFFVISAIVVFTQVLKYRVRYGPEPKLHFEN